MGSVPSMFAKNIVFEDQSNPYSGFMNAMGSPGAAGNEEGAYSNTRLKCSGVNTICESRKFINGQPTQDWTWTEASSNGIFDNSTCQHAYDNMGDPCRVTSRDLPKPLGATAKNIFDIKKWKTRDYILAGSLTVIVVGTIALLVTRKKK